MARDVLLNYVLRAQAIEPITAASRAYLHDVMVIAKLKESASAGIYEITNAADIANYTDSTGIKSLFDAGMSKIYLCAVADYAGADALITATTYKFFTVLIDPAFEFAAIPTALTGFDGVVGWATTNSELGQEFQVVATANNTAFVEPAGTTGANMYYAFGLLLSGLTWRNQQYAGMPAPGATDNLGTAETLFNNRLSFVLSSPEFGNRLAFFVNRGRAIVAPYIYEEFTLDLQSWALTYINANMPDYTDVEAAKLQAYLTKRANTKYVDSGMVETVQVAIAADQDNFVMSGDIGIAEPKATWRIKAQIQQGGINE